MSKATQEEAESVERDALLERIGCLTPRRVFRVNDWRKGTTVECAVVYGRLGVTVRWDNLSQFEIWHPLEDLVFYPL